MDEFELELKVGFLEEATQLLADAEQSFLSLESKGADKDLLNQIFRLAHNLKGSSRAVGFGQIAEFTHNLENLILKLKEGHLQITSGIMSVLLESNDHLNVMIEGLKSDLNSTFDSQALIQKIENCMNGNSQGEVQSEPTPQVVAAPQEEVASAEDTAPSADAFPEENSEAQENSLEVSEQNNEPHLKVVQTEESGFEEIKATDVPTNDLSEKDIQGINSLFMTDNSSSSNISSDDILALLALEGGAPAINPEDTVVAMVADPSKENVAAPVKPVPSHNPPPAQPPAQPPAASGGSSGDASKKPVIEETIRVSLSKLEMLNNYVGELVIIQSVLAQQSLNQHKQGSIFGKTIGQLSKLSKEIHEISMSLRMLPIKGLLQKMQRIVRDTSKLLNKEVELVIIGEETEIDKTALEQMNDPLVHIIRNAIDHGIETPEERLKVGKSAAGKVVISCFHEGNNLVIQVSDDGKGINPEIIRKKAIERKIISENQQVTDLFLQNLIFHAGFSTKDQVSEVSGRGVGMDVVKTNIQGLSGDVHVTSKVGEGSVFKITLPLSMAVIDGMIVHSSQNKFVFPLNQVSETLRLDEKILNSSVGLGNILNLRGKNIPVFRLEYLISGKKIDFKLEESVAVVVDSPDMKFAVIVDEVMQQQQVVVKNLGKDVVNKFYMGSSILGDGLPSLIIDLFQLGKNIPINQREPKYQEKSA